MIQLALWLGMATIALAVVGFIYFAARAQKLGVHPFYSRGRLLIVAGIGVIGVGLVMNAMHSARTTGPDGIPWLALGVSAAGMALWILGEIWERRANKNVKTLQRLMQIAEESRARMERDGEESTKP